MHTSGLILLVVFLWWFGIVSHLVRILKNDTKTYTPYTEDDLDTEEHTLTEPSKDPKDNKRVSGESFSSELDNQKYSLWSNPLSLDGE